MAPPERESNIGVQPTAWKRFKPKEIDMDIYFRRPIFWDDSVDVVVEEAGGHGRQWGW